MPDSPTQNPPPHGRLRRLRSQATDASSQVAHPRMALLTGALLVVLLAGASFLPVPYVIEQPGPAIDVLGEYEGEQIIQIQGRETYPSDGSLMLTTVSVDGGPGFTVTPAEVIVAWFDPTRAVFPRELLFPEDQSRQDVALQNTVQMNTSQQEAVAVALDELGISYGRSVVVSGIAEGAPAAGTLEAGDEILAVAGEPTPDVEAVQAAVAAAEPGSRIPITVHRDGEDQELSVPTEDSDAGAKLGIVLAAGYDFPLEVGISVGSIGGPSAGLMFSLTIYDELTPGALPEGNDIAGTGTIDEDGVVGPIGGIRQKLVGARDAGAEYFLAPGGNCDEVSGNIPEGLEVVRVDTFDDALEATQTIAATDSVDGLPTCEDS